MQTASRDLSHIQNQIGLNEIKFCCIELSNTLYRLKQNTTPYTGYSIARWLDLNPATQVKVLDSLKKKISVYNQIERLGIDYYDNKAILSYYVKSESIRVAKELIDHLGPSDVIEVYNEKVEQVFRNYRFLEVCSYDLLSLEVMSYDELYARSPQVTNKLHNRIHYVLGLNSEEIIKGEVPTHLVYEKKSAENRILRVSFEYAANILSQFGQNSGFICVQKAEVIKNAITNNELSGVL